MKALAFRLFRKLLAMIGLKRLLRWGWRHALYPQLKKLADRSEEGWDDKLLKFVDDNIYKAIDML